jgi:archaellum component FlaC
MPSPLSINRFADKVLEEGLKEMEKEELIDQGYKEFCENERKRFAAGAAGPNPRKLAKDYEALSQALNPRERETLPEAAKRLVAERDEALNQLANQPPPVIKEVIPPDLEGVREAFAELPPKLRKNLSIAQSISNIGSSLAEAEVAVENVDREIKLIKKEKERLEDQLKKGAHHP